MQVLLNTGTHVDGRHQMAEHLETVVKDALGRFGGQITRVEAHVAQQNSQVKGNPDEIHCTLEARLAGREPVVVKDHASTAHQAIHGAVDKLKRAVKAALTKPDARRSAGMPGEPDQDATLDSSA
ncbi:MAG TPA: HPF/RaiA family ribosome-associated protein [Albitalea sp.]|nr:HPF/RaiA family ribosome-associated protein [Albitalea sp.]